MKIGRNDPCPCGSGKKYKKCCLDKDEKKRREDAIPIETEKGFAYLYENDDEPRLFDDYDDYDDNEDYDDADDEGNQYCLYL